MAIGIFTTNSNSLKEENYINLLALGKKGNT